MDELLQAVAEGTGSHVVALDAGGTFLFADDASLKFLGRTKGDLGSFGVEDVLGKDEVAWVARMVGKMSAGAWVASPSEFELGREGQPGLSFAVFPMKYDRPNGEVAFVGLLHPKAAA